MNPIDVAIAVHAAAAALLIWAGGVKLASPDPAMDLLGRLGLPARPWMARTSGGLELAVGCGALALGGPGWAGSVAGAYMLFSLVVLRAKVLGVPSCGCFGQMESPPSWIHFFGDLLLAGVSLTTIGSGRSPADVVTDLAGQDPVTAGALVLMVAVLAGLLAVSFSALPELIHALGEAKGGSSGRWTGIAAPRRLGTGEGNRL